MAIATYVAVALNVGRRGHRLAVVARRPHEGARWSRRWRSPPRAAGARAVYVAIALSGMTALAAEVHLDAPAVAALWRDGLHLLADPRRCSSSASASAAASARRLPRTRDSPRVALGWCQMLLCGAMAWAAYMLTASLPYWPINPSISTRRLVQLPARSRPLPLGGAAGRDPLGRELPAGAGRGRGARAGSGPARRRRLRGQHGRRDRRLARERPRAGDVARHPACRSRC